MDNEAKLNLLRQEIARIEYEQVTCDHEWTEPYEDTMKEPIYETVWHGVDCWPERVGYKDVRCWSRKCLKCGKKETTKEYGEIATETKRGPIFR